MLDRGLPARPEASSADTAEAARPATSHADGTGTTHAVGPATPRASGPAASRPTRIVPVILMTAVLTAALSTAGTLAVLRIASPGGDAVAATPTTAATAAAATATVAARGDAEPAVAIAAAARPSVVTIVSAGIGGYSPFAVPASGIGSGFVVSADGLILTCNHVVAGAGTLTVVFDDGREVEAEVVATDATNDLAVVRAAATGLTPVRLGEATSLRVGQLVVAIGSPLGTYTESVTQGIVSGTDRSIDVSLGGFRRTTRLSGLIQTDAAINSGSSGGPLLDASGAVVGVVTADASDAEGVGFAVPIDAALALLEEAAAS